MCVDAPCSADLRGSTVMFSLFSTTVSNTDQIICLSLTSQYVSVPVCVAARAGERVSMCVCGHRRPRSRL